MVNKRIRFLSLDQLMEMQANGDEFKLVEVLSEESYKSGHIPGAISLPVPKIPSSAVEVLKKDETVVVYCANYHCHASTNAAIQLMDMGFEDVLDFKGSKKAWTDAGLELEK